MAASRVLMENREVIASFLVGALSVIVADVVGSVDQRDWSRRDMPDGTLSCRPPYALDSTARCGELLAVVPGYDIFCEDLLKRFDLSSC